MEFRIFKSTKDRDILINASNITAVVTSEESETECLVYFNGESDNCIRVKGDILHVSKILRV